MQNVECETKPTEILHFKNCFSHFSMKVFFCADKKDITVKFFNILPSIAEGTYISDEVIRESSRSSEPRRSQLEGLIRKISPLLLWYRFRNRRTG